jgi:hypothetical protein
MIVMREILNVGKRRSILEASAKVDVEGILGRFSG